MTHKLPHGGHKVDQVARLARKKAKRKLLLGLRKDPRTGYKTARSR